jgi:hypothetical protein
MLLITFIVSKRAKSAIPIHVSENSEDLTPSVVTTEESSTSINEKSSSKLDKGDEFLTPKQREKHEKKRMLYIYLVTFVFLA